MAEPFDLETRQRCAELWVEQGLTYEQVAGRTGVSVATLKKWAEAEGWGELRREYRETRRQIRANTIRLRKALIEKALASLHPQDVYAVTSLETVMLRAQQTAEGGAEAQQQIVVREIKTPEDAVAALQAALEQRVNGMLARGDITLSAVRDVKHTLELIEKLKEKYMPQDAQQPVRRELDDQTLQHIKDIYGIS